MDGHWSMTFLIAFFQRNKMNIQIPVISSSISVSMLQCSSISLLPMRGYYRVIDSDDGPSDGHHPVRAWSCPWGKWEGNVMTRII